MDQIRSINVADAELEVWQPEGVTIHEGNPRGRGFTLHEDYTDGSRGLGLFECDPGKTTYELTTNEIIYVLEGRATIELDNGSKAEVAPGDMAFLPSGHLSTWTFHSTFKEFWVLCD